MVIFCAFILKLLFVFLIHVNEVFLLTGFVSFYFSVFSDTYFFSFLSKGACSNYLMHHKETGYQWFCSDVNIYSYHFYSLQNVKTPWRSVTFTKSITLPWVFFTFLKLYKWYQVVQSVSYMFLAFTFLKS